MPSLTEAARAAAETVDQRVTLYDVSWADFELILQIRGDHGGVRLTYLSGSASRGRRSSRSSDWPAIRSWCGMR